MLSFSLTGNKLRRCFYLTALAGSIGLIIGLSFNPDGIRRYWKKLQNPVNIYLDTSDKTKVAINSDDGALTLLILGQSNAGNHGLKRFPETENVYNFWGNELYKAKDPLLGGSSNGGSFAIPLAKNLINKNKSLLPVNKTFERVTLINFSVGASSVSDWLHNKHIQKQMLLLAEDVKKANRSIDYVLWIQGERDNVLKTEAITFKRDLKTLLEQFEERFSPREKILIGISTRCAQHLANGKLAAAITELSKESPRYALGADSDSLGWEYRYDGCHYSEEGQKKLAMLWSKGFIELLAENAKGF